MSIAIDSGTAFDIETYDGLVAFITGHLELDNETVAQLPTLIRQSEARLDRLCTVPERETSSSVVTTASTRSVALPIDARHLRNARLTVNYGYSLEEVSLDFLHDHYPDNVTGKPIVYTIAAESVHLGPIPDAAYTITYTYTAKIPNISATNQSNWLLESNPDAYVYAVLMQTSAWLEDLDAAGAYRGELMSIIDEVNLQGNRRRRTSPMRLRSPVVV